MRPHFIDRTEGLNYFLIYKYFMGNCMKILSEISSVMKAALKVASIDILI